jgi:hypothetical protein
MRLRRASERVRRIAIAVLAMISAALVLWRLSPSEPVPPVRLPPADRTSDEAPRDDTDPGS